MTGTELFDLHSHSLESDGILSPEALVSRAKLNNVTTLALTDHDTLAGIGRAKAAALVEGMKIITGIELSSQWAGRGIHIVGLNIDVDSPSMEEAVSHQLATRETRAEQIGRRLEKYGITNALAGAREFSGGAAIGRPHFGRFLVEQGHVKNMNQAFKKYLGAGKPGDVKQDWPEFDTVIGWIHRSGGVAVLAHPCKYKMTRSKLCAMVRDFADLGGDAMEVVCGPQTPAQTSDMLKIANQFGLKASCGSDFHSPGAQWQELGRFPPLPDGIEPVWSCWQ